MKFSLITALVVELAVAHGSEAVSLVKRDIQSEVNSLTKILNDISASFTSTTKDMVEKMKALDMTNIAQTYMEDSKTKIQPLVDQLLTEAAKLQEEVKPFVTSIEDQVKPLMDVMEKYMLQIMDQTKSLLPSR